MTLLGFDPPIRRRVRVPSIDTLVCVGFGGDSPVEYLCEDEPDEPAPFDLDAVNRHLAELWATSEGR